MAFIAILSRSWARPRANGRVLALVLGLLASASVRPDALFDTDTILEFELEGPLKTLLNHKEDKQEYPFLLRQGGVELNIRVRAGGNSRLRICEFPPLRLNFRSRESSDSVFNGWDKIKLVTHCRGEVRGDKNAAEEYAAYRIFHVLSNVSYRVRPVRIRYIDTDKRAGNPAEWRFAFLVEPRETLKARTGGTYRKLPEVKLSWLNQEQASLVYVFQYWIGNTDWSLLPSIDDEFCCHNGDLLEMDAGLFLVPYDFDLSGLVNASYAKPDPSLRLQRVTQRRYRGYCTKTDALRFALERVRSLEQKIYAVIEQLPVLSQKDKNRRIGYLEKAFRKAENQEKTLKAFENACLGR